MSSSDLTGSRDSQVPAQPLKADEPSLPDHIRSYLLRAQTHWLKNTEVLSILQEYESYGLPVSSEPPVRPPGGSIFLFDRKAVRFFRKDGHRWRKKADGKTVRETHEKLKVGNMEMLNCYYAHSERDDGPQRRCYWQLRGKDDIVLVHYLVVDRGRASGGENLVSLPSDLMRLEGRGDPVDMQHFSETCGEPIGANNSLPPDFALPSMSMDTFLAAMDEQDSQRLRAEQGDEYADSFLPTWDELAINGVPGDAGLALGGRDWMASPISKLIFTHCAHRSNVEPLR